MLLNCGVGSPLDCEEIQPVHPKGDQSWVFIGRTDAEAETPILGPPDTKSWLIWKDTDAGKDWGQEEKGMTEDEIFGWHHRLNGHGFGWTLHWWWIGRPGVLKFMGSQRIGHDWVTELNWTSAPIEISQVLKERIWPPRILCPVKIRMNEEKLNIFSYERKRRELIAKRM